MAVKKPPLGIMPKLLHDELRYINLRRAICIYAISTYQINPEWVKEYKEYNLNNK